MASKKKSPSFEIPDLVRQAGQSGWVYRSDRGGRTPRHAAAAHGARMSAAPPAPGPRAIDAPSVVDPPAEAAAGTAQPRAWTLSTGVIGLGLHVCAVPLVVPLFVTAAISRKLGLLPR